MARSIYLNFDDAWDPRELVRETINLLEWGPKLRFSAPVREIEEFFAEQAERAEPFILYGSGDFHHLTALWLRRIREPLVVVSFDNHPDWDVRPPRWSCGGWVNRALELPQVEKVCVWGCGNFESWWPGQIFGNRRAEKAGRLDVHPWADERPIAQQTRRGAIFRGTWRAEFERFVADLNGTRVYLTVDLDCLQRSEAITNWENGKLALDDVVWAIGTLRKGAQVIAGDLCGAYSRPKYARWKQRFAAGIDHPKLPEWEPAYARTVNRAALERLWPILAQ